MRNIFFGPALAFALSACQSQQAPIQSTALAPKASNESGAVQAPPREAAERLALMPMHGKAAIDRRITELIRVVKARPGKLDPWILLGQAWIQKARETSDPGYYLNAEACVEVALDISPGDKLALGLRGLVLLNRHEFKAARDLARSILERAPEEQLVWGNLSDALLELGEFEEAAQSAQKMMDLKPNLPAYTRASYLQWLQGDTKAALETIRLAIDAGRDPNATEARAWALVQAGFLFWHEGDYAGADAGFEMALASRRDYPPALVGRGRVAMARGDYQRAIELYARAFELSPLVETAWLLGEARELTGETEAAKQAFAYAEKAGFLSDPRTLSLMYSTRNLQAPLALRLAQTEAEKRRDVYTEDALAWALYRNGRTQEAKAAIDHARRYGTRDARLIFHQGVIYLASRNVALGRKLLREALRLNPKFDVSGPALASKLLAQES